MGAPGTTPGPWSTDAAFSKAGAMQPTINAAGTSIAMVRVKAGIPASAAIANAFQMRASPDLYDQLTFAVKLLDNLPGFRGTAQLDRMHAALAKARGE